MDTFLFSGKLLFGKLFFGKLLFWQVKRNLVSHLSLAISQPNVRSWNEGLAKNHLFSF